jgi:hypothetical protein
LKWGILSDRSLSMRIRRLGTGRILAREHWFLLR